MLFNSVAFAVFLPIAGGAAIERLEDEKILESPNCRSVSGAPVAAGYIYLLRRSRATFATGVHPPGA